MPKLLRPLALVGALSLFGCPPKEAPPPAAPPPPAPPAKTSTTGALPPTGAQQLARGEAPENRDAADPDGVVRRGAPLSPGEAIPVEKVLTEAKTLAGKTVKVTGTVVSVCAKKGCWFEVEGPGNKSMRITSKGYKFFVPHSATGMKVTLEGELEVKTLAQEEAQHFADDKAEGTGKPAEKIAGPVDEVTIAAIGLEMTKSAGG